ncbi:MULTISPECIES: MFS transporter [unclassified Amycolatopsis]|uniref:MFS transporter n=1 Tax=unclassified Amycolatopsis TaxID=2618356 RepID=UPI002876CDE6|nr:MULTISPECIES: MFS transporter [unclassified Amycolatopsis]MDS0137846.1 MFS transporter [Amycolatopsis sp. 505]MDS0144241.1 MFS transporter [Amycolatopsis sp. CM201R]
MTTERRPVLVVCLAVFGLMAGQQMLNPLLPPLAREFGFSEFALGSVWAIGGAGVVLASPFWGRRTARWGHRPVLLLSLLGAMASLLGFAFVAQLGLAKALAVPVLFTAVLLTRGVAFGLAWAATPVTAQSYIADVTNGPAARVRGMAVFGAAQGLALAVGPALGGLLSLTGNLLVPVYAAPVVLAAIAVVITFALPKPPKRVTRPETVKVSPFDKRLWPFLTLGFGLYLALAIVLMTIGFLVQDRLHLAAQDTGRVTSLVMLAGAGMIILVQVLAVPRLDWTPLRLVRVGAVVMTAGMLVVATGSDGFLLGAGVGVLGAGMGFATPGFMSAPTLPATREEQGAVAGLMGSSSALAFMGGPLLGTGLYEIDPVVPYLASAVLLAALTAFAFTRTGHPAKEPVAP